MLLLLLELLLVLLLLLELLLLLLESLLELLRRLLERPPLHLHCPLLLLECLRALRKLGMRAASAVQLLTLLLELLSGDDEALLLLLCELLRLLELRLALLHLCLQLRDLRLQKVNLQALGRTIAHATLAAGSPTMTEGIGQHAAELVGRPTLVPTRLARQAADHGTAQAERLRLHLLQPLLGRSQPRSVSPIASVPSGLRRGRCRRRGRRGGRSCIRHVR